MNTAITFEEPEYMRKYDYLNNRNFTPDAHKYTSCHHELKDGEIWLGNTSGNDDWTKGVDIPDRYSILKTVRLGEQAYDIHGKPISRDYCRPLIINKSEEDMYEKIVMRKM